MQWSATKWQDVVRYEVLEVNKHMWKVAILGLTTLVLIACGGGNGNSELSLAQWAAQVCGASERLAAIDDVGDDIDPSTLSLDERKARADDISEEMTAILDEGIVALEAIDPPSSVARYHEALTSQIRSLAEAIRNSQADVAKAQSHEEIEAANAQLNIVLERTRADVNEEAEALPDEAGAALRGVLNCGSITG